MAGASKYRRAVGLEYDGAKGGAPVVGVKGERIHADTVVKIAHRYGVPVVERPALTEALYEMEPDTEIPEDMFEAVAVLLSELGKGKK